MSNIEYIEDSDVLASIKNIFGDGVVTKAEIEKDAYHFDAQKDELSFDSCRVRITLFNGNVIEIWNSEWGGIEKSNYTVKP